MMFLLLSLNELVLLFEKLKLSYLVVSITFLHMTFLAIYKLRYFPIIVNMIYILEVLLEFTQVVMRTASRGKFSVEEF